MITEGGTSNSVNVESFVFRSTGQPGALHSASMGLASPLTSVPFCFQRERSRAHLLKALLLVCFCQQGDHGSMGDKARRALPPSMGRGHSPSSYDGPGLWFLEMMSNHIDRADHIPNSTFVLDPCLGPSLKRKRAKQLKQVARTAKTLQCRGRTCRFQSRTGFQPTSERTFPRCPLPSQVPFGLVPAQASLCNLRSSLAGPC